MERMKISLAETEASKKRVAFSGSAGGPGGGGHPLGGGVHPSPENVAAPAEAKVLTTKKTKKG